MLFGWLLKLKQIVQAAWFSLEMCKFITHFPELNEQISFKFRPKHFIYTLLMAELTLNNTYPLVLDLISFYFTG